MNAWLAPPQLLALAKHEVHVWAVELDNFFGQVDELVEILSPEELQQSQRFVNAQLTNSYIVSHALLRKILARYLQCKPQDLLIEKGPQGKPYLTHLKAGVKLEFNMSHTRGMALYALSEQAVGIDVEVLSRDVPVEELAERFFTSQEYQALCALPDTERQKAFYQCWTLKEAIIKALGHGLTYGLDKFEIDFSAEGLSCLKSIEGSVEEAKAWWLQKLHCPGDYVAAMAVSVPMQSLGCFILKP